MKRLNDALTTIERGIEQLEAIGRERPLTEPESDRLISLIYRQRYAQLKARRRALDVAA